MPPIKTSLPCLVVIMTAFILAMLIIRGGLEGRLVDKKEVTSIHVDGEENLSSAEFGKFCFKLKFN